MSEETAAKAGRGRPRPDATIERDKRVLDHLTAAGPRTRPQLVEELGMAGNEIYLSLYRLNRNDPVLVAKKGKEWTATGAGNLDAPVEAGEPATE
jgi:hypothetical protein